MDPLVGGLSTKAEAVEKLESGKTWWALETAGLEHGEGGRMRGKGKSQIQRDCPTFRRRGHRRGTGRERGWCQACV